MKYTKAFLISLIFFISACKETTPIPDCNPQDGRFIGGKHYVSGNMLTEDNNWDLIKLQKYHDRREKMFPDTNCIPVQADESFEETLQKKIEDIDYQGIISH